MASTATKHLRVSVITPVRTVLEQDAVSVVVPAYDGEWGILPGHAPLMALLGCGRLVVADAEGKRQRVAIRGGFLQVSSGAVTVLTAEAATAEEVDAAAVTQELRELKGKHPRLDADREAHEQKQDWANARLKIISADANAGQN